MSNSLRITLKTRDRSELRQLLSQYKLDLACGGARINERGETLVEAFVPNHWVEQLKAANPTIEIIVDEAFVPSLVSRSNEVGVGDRFAGGRIAPSGIGEKI